MFTYNNKLVESNIYTGSTKTQAFKKIVKKGFGFDKPENFSLGSMACAKQTFEALKENKGSTEELLDLMLFYVECGTQFTINFGDIDEDYYVDLEELFDEIILSIKKHSLLETFKERLNAILHESQDVSCGYGDQISDLLFNTFPGEFEL